MTRSRVFFFTPAVAAVLLSLLLSCTPPGSSLGAPSVTILLEGSATPLQSGATIPFGDVASGSQEVLSFTIENNGTAALQLTSTGRVSIGGLDPDAFSLTQAPDATVPANGGTTTFSIAFAPTDVGVKAAMVSIGTDVTDPRAISFMLAGTGVTGSPSVAILLGGDTAPLQTGTTVLFGDVVWGSERVLTFTIQNNGTATLQFASPEKVSIGGLHPEAFDLAQAPDATVPPDGGTTTFSIAFSPTEVGMKAAMVSIKTDVSDPQLISFMVAGSGIMGWRTLGVAGVSAGPADSVSLAVDGVEGTPYVAYVDDSLDVNPYPQVQKFASGSWSLRGDPGETANTGLYASTSLAVAGGIPYLAYSHSADGFPVRVVRYDSGMSAWAQDGRFDYTGSTPKTYLSLKEDRDGGLWVVYRDNSETGSGKASLYTDGDGWYPDRYQFTPNAASYLDLAFGRSSPGTVIPYVAYKDDVSGKANVYSAYSLTFVGSPDFSDGTADYTSMEVDRDGVVYVAYSDGAQGGKVTVMRNDGLTDWTPVGAKGFSAGAATFVSLASDRYDTLYVAYSDASQSGKLTVEKLNGTSWEIVGTAGLSAGTAESISLVCYGSTPYVAYRDGSVEGKVTVVKLE
jgi:hypothetical protein